MLLDENVGVAKKGKEYVYVSLMQTFSRLPSTPLEKLAILKQENFRPLAIFAWDRVSIWN